MKLTLQVQYTATDFTEAYAAVRAQKLQSISTLPAFYVFLAYSVGTMIGNLLQPKPNGAPADIFDVIVSSLPLLLISGYWAMIALRSRGRKAHGFVTPPPPLTGLGVAIPAFLCAAVFAISVASIMLTPVAPEPPNLPPPPRQPIGKLLAMIVLPFVPIVAMLFASVWLVLRLYSKNVVRAFELQVNLHRPGTVQIDEDAIIASDETYQTVYQWSGFIGWHETPNLVLLYRSYISFEMIPKRSFASLEMLQYFLDLTRRKIGERRGGFDLVQPPSLPPGFGARS